MVADLTSLSGVVYAPNGLKFRSLRNKRGEITDVQAPVSKRWYASGAGFAGLLPVGMRLQAIAIVESSLFENGALLAILGNCVFLAIQGPPGSYLDPALEELVELCFMTIFTLEVSRAAAAVAWSTSALAH